MTAVSRRLFATALVLALVVSGCTDEPEPPGTGAEVDASDETAPEATETPDAPTASDDEAGPGDSHGEADDDEVAGTAEAVEDGTQDTEGAVESVTDLSDGRHPSYLHGVDRSGRTLTVDVIQFLTGQAAVDAYHEEHPDDPDGPPNDYYIVNVNPRLRTLEVAPDVTVALVRLHDDGDADLDQGTWAELPDYLAVNRPEDERLSWNPYWITLEGGIVVAIEEQYLP